MNPWFFILEIETTSSASWKTALESVAIEHGTPTGHQVSGEGRHVGVVVLHAEFIEQVAVGEFPGSAVAVFEGVGVGGDELRRGALAEQAQHRSGHRGRRPVRGLRPAKRSMRSAGHIMLNLSTIFLAFSSFSHDLVSGSVVRLRVW